MSDAPVPAAPLRAGFRATFAWLWRALLGNRYAAVTMLLAVVLYSVFYPTAYRNEVASSLPVVVVDEDRTAESRALVSKLDSMRAIPKSPSFTSPASLRYTFEGVTSRCTTARGRPVSSTAQCTHPSAAQISRAR